MDEKLSESSVRKIDLMCERISVDRQLDKEIQRELRGHIEDLVLGYLTGERKVTEEDALLLAERHFGEPAKLRAMFGDAHRTQVLASFARRLGAFITAYMLAWIVMRVVQSLFACLAAGMLSASPMETWLSSYLVNLAMYPAVLALMILLLFRWRRTLVQHKQIWFLSMSATRLVITVISICLASVLMPRVVCSVPTLKNFRPEYQSVFAAAPFIRLAFTLVAVLVAAWWCDATLGWKRSPAFLAVMAIALAIVLSIVMQFGTWGGGLVVISTSGPVTLPKNLTVISPAMLSSVEWKALRSIFLMNLPGSFLVGLIGIPIYISVARRIAQRKQIETT